MSDEAESVLDSISRNSVNAATPLPTMAQSPVVRGRSSIGSKLLLAFIVLQVLAFLVALLTSLSLQQIQENQSELSSRTLPTFIRLEEVLGKTARVVEATRSLARVESIDELADLEQLIQRDLTALDNTVNAEKVSRDQFRNEMGELQEGFHELSASAARLTEVVSKNLELKAQRDAAWVRANECLDDILLLIDPLIIELSARRGEAFMRDQGAATAEGRRAELAVLRKLTESVTNGASFSATLMRIGLRLDQVEVTKSIGTLGPLERAHALDMRALALLLVEDCFDTVRPEVARLLINLGQLEASDSSLFGLQRSILEQGVLVTALESQTSSLRGVITARVDAVTGMASRQSQQGIKQSDRAIDLAWWILWGSLAVSVLVASAFMWLYVKRRIVDRLMDLNVSMSALTEGHLENLIPIDGNDELALMGVSLEQFRVNEIRLQTTTAGLRRRNEELSEFAHAASHDLRSPLRAIDNLASWLAEDCEKILPPDSKKHLVTMRGRITRMEGLLNGLLSYYRAGTRKGGLETQTLEAVLQSAVGNIHVPQGFEIIQTAGPGHITTWISPLELVLRNLMDNALKHHDKEVGTVWVEAQVDGNTAIFVVSDDGPGIPAAMRQRVFRIFATLKPRDEVENSGVGLSLVKKTVESVGGSVTLGSASEGGCQFTVRWPASPQI